MKPASTQGSWSIILSGILLAVSFLPLDLPVVGWVALVPLMLEWDAAPRTHRLFAEVLTAFLLAYALAFFWPLLHTYAEAPLVTLGSLAAVPLLLSLPFAFSHPVRLRHGRSAGLVVWVVLNLSVDLLLTQSACAFPWASYGTTQASALALNQFAEFTGASGLTLWMLSMNGLVFVGIRAHRKQRIAVSLAILTVIAGAASFSHWRRAALDADRLHLSVGIVQPSMTDLQWTAEAGTTRLRSLLGMSNDLIDRLGAPPALMIWPDMALPATFSSRRLASIHDQLRAWSGKQEVTLVTGALDADDQTSSVRRRAFLFRPEGSEARYDGSHDLVISRTLSLRDQAPWIDHAQQPNERRPTSTVTLAQDGLTFGVLLDHEVLLPERARRMVSSGALLLASMAYDGGWSLTPALRPDLNYQRLRAIETRHSVIHAAATHGSALVLPDGSIAWQQSHEAVAKLAAVPISSDRTFYVRHGNWLGWTSAAVSPLLLVWALAAAASQITGSESRKGTAA